MIGKLIKYEWKSSVRIVSIIWICLAGMALIAGFGLRSATKTGVINSLQRFTRILGVLSIVLYGVLIAAVVVATAIMIIQRFYKGLLCEEGYLMHTLPVSKHSLVASKGFVAAIVFLISSIVITLSAFLMTGIDHPAEAWSNIQNALRCVKVYPIMILLLVEGLILSVLFLLMVIYKVYLALAIGQLANKHRILAAIGAYLGINIVISILSAIAMNILRAFGRAPEWVINNFDSLSDMGQYQIAMFGIFLFLAVGILIFHFITERILTKKLNLL